MSEYCRKTFLVLAFVFFTVGSIAYSFYLIWLLVYLKDNEKLWKFASIPAFVIVNLITAAIFRKWRLYLSAFGGVILLEMFLFPMLTRQAYYHLSTDVLIGPEWVINSLKGSIIFFVSGFLVDKECRLQRIFESKDILNRGLLDFVDIFNLVQLLSLDQCVGIGSSMTEGSSLEMAIQTFCTLSLSITFFMYEISISDITEQDNNGFGKALNNIYMASVLYQNIPFLIIRIIVWAKYNVFSLGFMVKNIFAIFVCCAEIHRKIVGRSGENEQNVDETNNVNYQTF